MEPIEKIYESYYKDVYRFVLALSRNDHVAEDITQETFMKAIKAVDHFKGNCDVRVWLCQIAKNLFYTYRKKQIRQVDHAEEVVAGKACQTDIVKDMVDKEQAIRIHHIVHSLEEPYKEVFHLRVFGELPFKEIAAIFGKTESWARVTYHRARILIMKEMEEL